MIKLNRPACPYPEALAAKNYKHPNNKQTLISASHGKCMYCESKITHIDFGDVEHIKPKAEGKFPELTYEWSNLGLVCGKCNNEKSDKYFEDAPFVDPYSEDPDMHIFGSGSFIFQKNGCPRGEITIKEINLNRPELLEKRAAKIEQIITALNAANRTQVKVLKDSALEQLNREADPDKEYSLIIKALLKANAQT